MPPEDLLEVGTIAKPHGLNGEVVVALTTTVTSRVSTGAILYVNDRALGRRTLEVLSSRPHQHRYIVAFAGVRSREDAEALHGATLLAEPVEDAEAVWVHELIGAEVLTVDGRRCGQIEAVESNPASDLLVLADGTLVPEVFVVDVSGLPQRLVIDPPAGLLPEPDSLER